MILPLPETDREKILYAALEKYRIDGFSKTTMDEIAALSGLSKNTLYRYFPSKEKLTEEVVQSIIHYINSSVKKILNTRQNAIMKFLNMMNFIVNAVLKYHNNMLMDVKIYMPELWKKVDNLRSKYMYANISKIIRQGKKEKLFCDYPNEIIIAIFIGSIRYIINPEFITANSFSLDEAVDTTFEIILNGILTPKGKNIFKKLKNNDNDQIH
ncbi:MAG TPA: TetR/AcrR family transcriptional regulator [Ignavibacteria bacterium]